MLDLDAKRAARSEAQNRPRAVRFGGEVFSFPAKMPLEALELMATAGYRAAFEMLFDGDEEAAGRFFSHRPDDEDLGHLMKMYGTGPESTASPTSSPSTGNGLRPTGKRTTTGTSRRTAMASITSEPESS